MSRIIWSFIDLHITKLRYWCEGKNLFRGRYPLIALGVPKVFNHEVIHHRHVVSHHASVKFLSLYMYIKGKVQFIHLASNRLDLNTWFNNEPYEM